MRAPKPHPKNRWGLSTPEILREYFHRQQIQRRQAEPALRAEREAKADAAHIRRVARRETAADALIKRIRRMEKFPSVLAVRQLAEIAGDKAHPSAIRLQAALALLRMGDEAEA
jgi:hypothetical protein